MTYFCFAFLLNHVDFLLGDKNLVLICLPDILAFLKKSICPSFSKLLACQTCLGKYDCKYKIHIRFQLFCMNNKECTVLSRSVMSDSLQLYGLQPAGLLCPWGFSRQDYWSGLPFLPPGDIPNPGLNPGLPHCR